MKIRCLFSRGSFLFDNVNFWWKRY
uniref:Uncharacterized protein n=1 Tax=Musa acuminata subsp. malaccensis TaxID=214687 RepID=A0A804I2I8_MUSAM